MFFGGNRMNSRKSQILLGILLSIFGISIILIKAFQIRFDYSLGMMLGIALIFLYLTKKKNWALILGSFLFISRSIDLLQEYFHWSENLCGGFSFLVLGVALLWISEKGERVIYFTLGCFVIWAGIYFLLTGIPFFMSIAGALFFLCFGLGYMTIYLLGKGKYGKWILWLCIFNLAIGLILIRGNPATASFFHYFTYAAAVGLICFGLALLIKGVKNH